MSSPEKNNLKNDKISLGNINPSPENQKIDNFEGGSEDSETTPESSFKNDESKESIIEKEKDYIKLNSEETKNVSDFNLSNNSPQPLEKNDEVYENKKENETKEENEKKELKFNIFYIPVDDIKKSKKKKLNKKEDTDTGTHDSIEENKDNEKNEIDKPEEKKEEESENKNNENKDDQRPIFYIPVESIKKERKHNKKK